MYFPSVSNRPIFGRTGHVLLLDKARTHRANHHKQQTREDSQDNSLQEKGTQDSRPRCAKCGFTIVDTRRYRTGFSGRTIRTNSHFRGTSSWMLTLNTAKEERREGGHSRLKENQLGVQIKIPNSRTVFPSLRKSHTTQRDPPLWGWVA